jgi:8-oxo-dGTP diphosphatase
MQPVIDWRGSAKPPENRKVMMVRPVPHTVVVDVMLILERDGLVLLAERSGTGYADGALNLPSGKLEPGEDVVAAVIREAHEEVGVVVDRADGAVHVMQHLSPEGQTRVGWFFRADRWVGEPYNAEPHKCARLLWAPVDQLPGNTWPYTTAGLAQYRAGTPFSLHGFTPEPVAV